MGPIRQSHAGSSAVADPLIFAQGMVLIRKQEAAELFESLQFVAHVGLVPLALYLSMHSNCVRLLA